MKQVALSKNQKALVDDEDYEFVQAKPWYAHFSSRTKSYYAYREERTVEGKRYSLPMHRYLLGLAHGNKVKVDHIDHNTLNNQKDNLRIVSNSENSQNRRNHKQTVSGYKGVSWHRKRGKWTVSIKKNRVARYLGLFPDPISAAQAYDKAAKELFGEFAYLNFN